MKVVTNSSFPTSIGRPARLRRAKLLVAAAILTATLTLKTTSLASGLYNTGVDQNGNVLADGQPDPHYWIVDAPVNALPLRPVTVDSTAWQFSAGWLPNDSTGSTGSRPGPSSG